MNECKNYIYIMTNPAFPDLIKIGYANNPEQRRRELSHHSGVPSDFEIYATSEVPTKLTDNQIHQIIHQLNPALRYNEKREFFTMNPEDAYKLLKAIAEIYGKGDFVRRYTENNDSDDLEEKGKKQPSFRFSMCEIVPGDYITYTNDNSLKFKVLDDKHVEYEGNPWSLSPLAAELLFGDRKRSIQGPLYFEFNGKTLPELRKEKENHNKTPCFA